MNNEVFIQFILIAFLIHSISVPCAVGTYFDQANKTCNACPQGSYQSETGQLQCLRCPNIAGRIGVTAGSGARSAADCKGEIKLLNIEA